jgi:hypothetical protein
MKKYIVMIAFFIGLTFSFAFGNTFSSLYNDDLSVHNPSFIETPVIEPEIILEDWMFEIHIVNPPDEKKIELEDWMIDMDKFYRNDIKSEDQPELEGWMLQDSFNQEKEQEVFILENWMFYFS